MKKDFTLLLGVPVASQSNVSCIPEQSSAMAVPGPSTISFSSPLPAIGDPIGITGPPNNLTAPPPPTYESVLELKRKEEQLNREIAEEEEQERNNTTG